MQSESGYDATLWQALCEQVGVAALPIPEEYDGFGASLVETAVVLEELGRNLAPTPLLATTIATAALLLHGSDELKGRLLPQIAIGEPATVATGELVLDGATTETVLGVVDGQVEVLHDVDIEPVEALDQTINLGRLASTADPVPTDLSGRRLGPDQCTPGGRRPARARHDRRLQQGAGAVRATDRLVPGAQAPDGRHARARRGVAIGLVGRDGRRGGVRPGPDGAARRDPGAACRRGAFLLLRRARPRGLRDRRSCTAASRSPGSTTPSWSSSARTR